jgi:hypothetical protein
MPREAAVGTYRGECGCAGVDDTAATIVDMSIYALLLMVYKASVSVFGLGSLPRVILNHWCRLGRGC